MTPDDMKMVAAECDAIARELAPVQDAGLFAPVTVNWTGTADDGGGRLYPAELRVTEAKDGKFTAVLTVADRKFVVNGTPDAQTAKPVVAPKMVHRVVNATLSAANTFNHLLAGGDVQPVAPDPKGS